MARPSASCFDRTQRGRRPIGPEAPLTAASLVGLAKFYLKAQKWSEAYQASGRAEAMTVKQMRREGESLQRPQSGHGQVGIDPVRRNVLLGHVGVAAHVADKTPSRRATLTLETYVTAQWALQSDAAVALSQMSARFGKGDDELGRLVRERQDLVARYRALEASLGQRSLRPAIRVQPAAQANQAKEMAAIDGRIGATDALLASRFPEYASLANPEPLSIADTQALLKADEALILGGVRRRARVCLGGNARGRAMAFNTDRGERLGRRRCRRSAAGWIHRTGRTRHDGSVASSLQAERYRTVTRCLSISPRPTSLYATLLGPFESLLRGKRLLIVPSGPLTTLPFEVLVTERPPTAIPSDPTAYQRASWLAKRHAISMLPSVASLRALRRFAKASRATSQYAGFGNPLLLGPDGTDRSAALKQSCPRDPREYSGGRPGQGDAGR